MTLLWLYRFQLQSLLETAYMIGAYISKPPILYDRKYLSSCADARIHNGFHIEIYILYTLVQI